jgi:sterol 3beta-glucosyltransferase
MEPLDPANPCDFYITYNSVNGLHTSFFTVDTEVSTKPELTDSQQSAIQWRRAFDSALFRHARMRWRHNEAAKLGVDPHSSEADLWNMMRCCIPLDRVTIKGISDYHGFSTLIGLEIELDGEVKVTWHPEQLARGDFSGSLDGDRPPRHGFTKTGSGASTPQRSFSLRNALPFVKGARATPESASPSRTPTSSSPTPGHRQSTVFLDSTLPPRLALLSQGKDDKAPPFYAPGDDWLHAFTFNIAVLNEQAWFAEALQAAVDATAERKYKQGAQRPRMIMEVAGYDCLATDEEVEAKGEVGSRSSTSSSDGEDDEGTLQSFAKETRKAEKAALASKVFGLKEDEGIWRE